MSDGGIEHVEEPSLDLGIDGVADPIEIGRGGFGIVYRASEADLGRTVAVKILTGAFDERSKLRFNRERMALGSLSNDPNIVTVHRTGISNAGLPYLVMEYLEGGSVADKLAHLGRLPWTDTLRIGLDISSALQSSHEAGVLHRDIKPGNVLLTAQGVAKLGDFGIARLAGEPETKSAVITASLAHAPPEVLSGRRPDVRSDGYSLASCLYELLSGTPAFVSPSDESMLPMLARIAQDDPPSLYSEQLPHALVDVIEAGMAKDPDRRFQSAALFHQALLGVNAQATEIPRQLSALTPQVPQPPTAIHGHDGQLRTPAQSQSASGFDAHPPSDQARGDDGTGLEGQRWRLWVGLGLGLIVLLAAFGITFRYLREDTGTAQTTASTAQVDSGSIRVATSQPPTTSFTTSITVVTSESFAQAAPATSDPVTTILSQDGPATFRIVSDSQGGIRVNLPSEWTDIRSELGSVVAAPSLQQLDAGDSVAAGAFFARHFLIGETVEFDLEVESILLEQGCSNISLSPYDDGQFRGILGQSIQCSSSLSVYVVMATDLTNQLIVLAAMQSVDGHDFAVINEAIESITFDLTRLP